MRDPGSWRANHSHAYREDIAAPTRSEIAAPPAIRSPGFNTTTAPGASPLSWPTDHGYVVRFVKSTRA